MNIIQLKKEYKKQGYKLEFDEYEDDEFVNNKYISFLVYGNTDPRLVVDANYLRLENKNEAIDLFYKLLNSFDFSFYLEFNNIRELKEFIK